MGAAERLPDEPAVAFRAHTGPQSQFLASQCFEVLYGGEAGGGKSVAVVAMPLRWVSNPALYAVTFRRTAPELQPLLALSARIYKGAFPDARFVSNPYPQWRFPSGAIIRYGAMEAELDYESWLGQEIPVLCFDELTTFTRNQYRALIGRVRSSVAGLPRRVRATTNPGSEGLAWVFERWAPWLDPQCEHAGLPERFDPVSGDRLPPARSGQVLWVLHDDQGAEEYVPAGTRGAESRTFIRARLEDNPTLMANDPGYEHRLLDNDPVRVAQLRFGNWLIRPGAGLLFKRAWFAEPLEVAPPALARIRYWDRAATEVRTDAAATRARKKGGESGPDWSVGTRYSWNGSGKFTVEDVVRLRGDPGSVFNTVLATAHADGKGTIIGIEQDPASAGKFEAMAYARALGQLGFEVRLYPVSASKVRRAGPVSAQAKAGNVRVVAGRWFEQWIQELEQFPDGSYDDQVDSLSGAHAALTTLPLRTSPGLDYLPPA